MKGNKKPRKNGQKHDEQLSRNLSWILRHGAIDQGLKMDSTGFVKLKEVMDYLKNKKGMKVTVEQIYEVVENNDKKRFEIFEEKDVYIRATQGHSIKIVKTEDLLKEITDPTEYPVVIHGTYMKFWSLIKKDGLKRMTRNHMHFAPGMPKEEGVISGMRGSCDIYIEVDMFAAMKEGVKFYISSNNVILTEGVDGVLNPKYFKRVVKKDGTVIQEMGKQL